MFTEPCPPAIAMFAREWLVRPRQPSLATRLVRGALLLPDESNEPPTLHADVRRFAVGEVVARSCSGAMLGRWTVDASVERTAPEPTPWAPDPPGVVCEVVLRTLVVNFACTDAGDACVVEVIDMAGRTERAVYQLPNGINGLLGPAIGPPQVTRQKRSRRDLCLPAGWTPSSPPFAPSNQS